MDMADKLLKRVENDKEHADFLVLIELCLKYTSLSDAKVSATSILKKLFNLSIYTSDDLYKASLSVIEKRKGIGKARYKIIWNMWCEIKELRRIARREEIL